MAKKQQRKPHPKLPAHSSKALAHITPDLRALAVPVDSLIEDPANVRLHDQDSQRELGASYASFTQRKPVVAQLRSEGAPPMVRAGNGTLRALRAAGHTWVAAVVVHEDDVTATAYAIADNRTAELSKWDLPALKTTLAAIDFEVPGVDEGFLKEIDALLAAGLPGSGGPGGDDPGAGDPPEQPVSEVGALYELGPHRLLCGDATDKGSASRLFKGAEPNLMVTDPPYGINYDASWRDEALDDGANRRTGKVPNDDRADWREAWALFPGSVAYVYHAGSKCPEVAESIEASGLELRGLIIWAKPRFAISRGHYHYQHEPCWYAVRKGKTASWCGDRSQTTLWAIGLDKNLEGEIKHSTQKPLECMERPIRNHEGDVYDPFCGSGTTLIAAARQGRACYAMELSPAYCDVIRRRWTAYADEQGIEAGPGALRD